MSDTPTIVVIVLGRGKHDQAANVVRRLRKQSVKPEIYFWDSGDHGGISVDRYCKAAEGESKKSRWDMALFSDAEYVCVIDDDMAISSSKLLERCIQILTKPENVFSIVGLHGIQLKGRGLYSSGVSIGGNLKDTRVDIVKDNFMVLRRNLLKGFLMEEEKTEDDIAVCFHVARRRRSHLIPGGIREYVMPPKRNGSGRAWDKKKRNHETKTLYSESSSEKRGTVFYTAVVGDRDVLKDPLDYDENCDFICFSDRHLHSKVWDVVRVERTVFDYALLSRRLRSLGHRWFRGHRNIVWVDGNCRLKNASVEMVEGWLKNASVVSFRSWDRQCAYRELRFCAYWNKEPVEITKEQASHYKKEGFPEEYGLTLPVLVARKNIGRVREFSELWWSEICNWGKRGELSFDYCRWKTGISHWWFQKDVHSVDFLDYFPRHPRWLIDVLLVKNKMSAVERDVFNRARKKMEKNEHLLVSVLDVSTSGIGLVEARNQLLRKTSQPVICMMDAGVRDVGGEKSSQIEWQALYEKLMEDSRVGVVIPARENTDTFPEFSSPDSLDCRVMVMRREDVEEVGGLDERYSIDFSEKDFLFKILEKGMSVMSHNWSAFAVTKGVSKRETQQKPLDADFSKLEEKLVEGRIVELAKEIEEKQGVPPFGCFSRPDVSVIIPFYNYHNEKILVRNHVRQVEHLLGSGVDVVTVELARDEKEFTLPDCGGRKIKLLSDAVLWHKESLVNLGAKSCDSEIISWHDSGCILDDDWVQMTIRAMQDHDLVQCFSRALWISEKGNTSHRSEKGIVKTYREGRPDHVYGGAWAAKRSLFDEVGLYAGCIVGGGDVAFASLLGETIYHRASSSMSSFMKTDFDRWVDRASALKLRIGYVPGKFRHLWHGEYFKRQYRSRHEILKKANFDPVKDLRVAENGTLAWSANKPRMQKEILGYFFGRKI